MNIEEIISRQTTDEDITLVKITSRERVEEEKVTIVTFDYGDYFEGLKAIVYDDGICFTPSDWTMPLEDAWYDHENKRTGIVLNGLPRYFA